MALPNLPFELHALEARLKPRTFAADLEPKPYKKTNALKSSTVATPVVPT
jgi:hypothetical protein